MKAHSESMTPKAAAMTDAASDPFQWLEEVEGKTALDWVATENKRSLDILQSDPRYEALHSAALKIVNASDQVPMPSFRAGGIDNFWQDKDAVRGVWRRTSLESYRTKTPQWETVLDIDALSKSEAANWVYKGSNCLAPEERLCLVSLSDGGKDAVEVREFDTAAKAFVKDGFALPAGKQQAAWIDKDTLLVGREWTPGLVTESGYPFVIKRLKRGQALGQATEVFAGTKSDVGVWPGVIRDADGRHVADYVTRAVGFFDSEVHILTPKGSVRLLVPTKSSFQAYLDGQAIFTLEEAWTAPNGKAFAQGALISFDLAKAIGDPKAMDPVLILAPNARQSIEGVTTTRSRLLVTMTTNVVGEVWSYAHGPKGWSGQALNLPKNASLGLVSANDLNDQVFVSVTSFLSPTSLWLGNADAASLSEVKAAPARFDASDLVTEQFEATSKDGTKIPYFVVRKKALVLDGTAPTLLYAYGGFQVSMTPAYSGLTGKLWLERGGVYVLANIRGGGEFGPAWHQAGLKTKRQAIYDDFAAVAEDLITRKITSPRHLGIQGGSNGGLLMGVQMTQRPELWRAVVVQVPLLDMLRYNQLLAGASWVDEYGDPADPAEGAFLRQTSPYQNLKTGVDYPEPFFVTSTKDDRVHPAHARKMAARMQAMGLPFFYYENTDGGHSAAANLKEVAKRVSLEFTYLTRKLMD
jgi:prolyl oligopeptidase